MEHAEKVELVELADGEEQGEEDDKSEAEAKLRMKVKSYAFMPDKTAIIGYGPRRLCGEGEGTTRHMAWALCKA